MKGVFAIVYKMLMIICVTGIVSVHTFAADNTVPQGQIVATKQGLLRGTKEDSICVWRGIQYAKQPVGELRFRAPQAPEAWSGVKDALVFGHVAPQTRRATKEANKQGEDCLSLNVWSPAPDGKKRPVMFWIHGGGFLVGSGASPLYNGKNLSKNGDVVVVTINYRMGALGFLYFNDIKGSKTGFDNNLGIRDQVAALQWVKENIAAFGGDPEAVTIFGESAGAISVLTLMNMPSAKGLFKRAIVESAVPESLMPPKVATEMTLRYLKMLNISPDNLDQLRYVTTDTLVAVMDRLVFQLMYEPSTVKILSPTIDGEVIPSDLMSAIKAGKATGVDLMIGTNKDEATLLALKRIGLAPRNAVQLAPYLANIEVGARKLLVATYKRYPRKSGILEMTTDGIFVMPSIRCTEMQTSYASTYMYRFDWSSPLLRMVGLRSCHGLELPFVFGTLDEGPGRFFTVGASRKAVHRISQQMQLSWVNFARYGNPDPSGKNEWGKYTCAERSTMIFDTKSHIAADPADMHRKAWTGLTIFK